MPFVAGQVVNLAGGGPALLDAPHWATERPWLDVVADELRADLGLETVVSDLVTDVWTVHVPAAAQSAPKESQS